MTDTLEPILDLRRRLRQMVEGATGDCRVSGAHFMPPLDIVAEGGEISILVELPGLSRDDIHVELQGNLLTITGERKTEPDDGRRLLRRERPCGRFSRSLVLPTDDHNELSASLHDGVLTVHVRRQKPQGAEG